MKHLFRLLSLFAAPLLAPAAVTTVFDADFGNSTIFTGGSYPAPTSSVTSFGIASSNSGTSSSSTAAGLFFAGSAGTSRQVEAQALFTGVPVTLGATGDFVRLQATFTVSNLLVTGVANTSAILGVGLYNSGGVAPFGNLSTNPPLLSNAASEAAAGGTQNWLGYNPRFVFGNAAVTNSVVVRPAQPGTFNNSQSLIKTGASASYPTATTLAGAISTVGLANATVYTLDYTLTYNATTPQIAANMSLYLGAGTGGTLLDSVTANISGANIVATAFDGLAIGYRYAGTSAVGSITVSDLSITTNVGPVPEPGEYALAAGALALLAGLAARRRRRGQE